MTNELPSKLRALWSKRLVLLASVAAIGGGVMLAGPSYPPVSLNGTPARADAVIAQPQSGFADLIEKVKPAVISVRVKIEDDGAATGSGSRTGQFFGENNN